MTVETFNPSKAANKTTTLETPVKTLTENRSTGASNGARIGSVSYTHLTLPTNREV